MTGTTTAAAATFTIESVQPNNNNSNSNTENSFYFDEHNNNSRSISFIGASATATSSAVFPMTSLDQLSTTTGRTVNASMRAELAGSTTIRSQSEPATATTKSTKATSATSVSTTTTTTKSARSTAKQPNDSARSRNHWTYGGTGDAERSRTFRNKFHHENHYGPFFEEPSNQIDPGKTLVSAVHLFTEAVLNCRVGMLKDKTVRPIDY